MLPIHPSFRVIATAEPPAGASDAGGGSSWLDAGYFTIVRAHDLSVTKREYMCAERVTHADAELVGSIPNMAACSGCFTSIG